MGRFLRVDRCDWLEMNRLKPGSVLIRGGSREDGFPASGKNPRMEGSSVAIADKQEPETRRGDGGGGG